MGRRNTCSATKRASGWLAMCDSDDMEAREVDCLAAEAVDMDVRSDDSDDVDPALAIAGFKGAPTGASAQRVG